MTNKLQYPMESDQAATPVRAVGPMTGPSSNELRPLYATEVVVSATPEEVLLDFFCGIKPPTSHQARIVISRPHLARLQRLLEQVLSTPVSPLDQPRAPGAMSPLPSN